MTTDTAITKLSENQSRAPEASAKQSACCAHCGTPLGQPALAPAFCCSGCKLVYHSLQGLGLAQFYALRNPEDRGRAAEDLVAERSYQHFDTPEFSAKYVHTLPQGQARVVFYLPGIHCAGCIWLLEKLPQFAAGVTQSLVHFGRNELALCYDPQSIKLSSIATLLNSLGYAPIPAGDLAAREHERRQDRKALLRIGVAGVCMMNTMMLAVSLFQGLFTGMEEPFASLFRWLSALIAAPAVFYAAWPFYQSALRSLLLGALHIDLPISIAIVGAYAAGVLNTLAGREYVYFDSITTLIFLLLVARWIQQKAVRQARSSARTSWEFLPATALLVKEETTEKCSVKCAVTELPAQALIEVPAGEIISADGIIESGSSSIDSALLTGESLPQAVAEGTAVFAGTLNLDSRLLVRVQSAGAATRVAKILAEVEASQFVKSPLENAANKLSGYFVAGVLALAALTYLVWYFIDPLLAFDHMVAVLIVTCPCALGLAIPAAVSVAIGAASRAGILVKRADALERLAASEHYYFDKTGTLTEGTLVVEHCEYAAGFDAKQSAALAAYLAACSPQHPAARALVKALAGSDALTAAPLRTRLIGGRGVLAELGDGSTALLGSRKWCLEQALSFDAQQQALLERWEAAGLSPLIFAREGSVRALFGLRDSLAPAASHLLQRLQLLGRQVYLLSGDAKPIVQALAAKLSVPQSQAYGACYPEQKAAILSANTSRTVMIGDGVNDALAMRQADLAIALRGGIEAALEVADIFVIRGGLEGVDGVVRAAQKLRAVIRRNLAFSVGYNCIGGLLALLGYVNPFIAALVMPLSSLTVIGSSVAARYYSAGPSKAT
jgi:Cu2+-exporting ATPase